jgi:hypothetical protein
MGSWCRTCATTTSERGGPTADRACHPRRRRDLQSSPRFRHSALVIRCPTSDSVSHRLTSLAPQPRHKTLIERRFPWYRRFDLIFRNDEVTGSNPVSSTESPGQGRATLLRGVSNGLAGDSWAPQRLHSPAGDSSHEHLSYSEVLWTTRAQGADPIEPLSHYGRGW